VLASMCVRLCAANTAGSDLFPYRQGWLGGDAAYSIPLDRSTTVWLFGDTFVGDRRSANGMIHNSIAIRKCERTCEVSYWWSGVHTSHPDAFFKTSKSNYFWPLDGFVHNGTLYVFLEQMRATPEGGAFGFDYESVKLATISNPNAAPDKWQISYYSVSEGNQVVPGVAAVVDETDGEWLYAFTLFRQSRNHPFVGLLRSPLDQVTPKASHLRWQYLSSAAEWVKWTPSTSPPDASELLSGNITEMSVKYHPQLHSWVAVYPDPSGSFRTACYSRAARVSDPWTTSQALFAYPEMRSSDSRHTASVFCYAAKEHPELESGNKVAITYACNSFKEAEIFRDLRLYRPELVVTHLPASAVPVGTPHR